MTIITYTMEEADGLLDYQAPELNDLDTILAVDGKDLERGASANEVVEFADEVDEEENETFSIDD